MADPAHVGPPKSLNSSSISHGTMNQNGLATQISPYLLKHSWSLGTIFFLEPSTSFHAFYCTNPRLFYPAFIVNWLPYGTPAFTQAEREDKPIFLSIGYETCRGCALMDNECFKNSDIANMLNSSFVCVKIDKEELPEVDDLYMKSALVLGVPGGWPLNLWITPQLLPFLAGTSNLYWFKAALLIFNASDVSLI